MTQPENHRKLAMEASIVVRELEQVREICGEWSRVIGEAEEKQVHINVDQMRRELMLCAAKLEAVVASEG